MLKNPRREEAKAVIEEMSTDEILDALQVLKFQYIKASQSYHQMKRAMERHGVALTALAQRLEKESFVFSLPEWTNAQGYEVVTHVDDQETMTVTVTLRPLSDEEAASALYEGFGRKPSVYVK